MQAAEDAWNTRDPERVAGAYTPDTVWRNRSEFVTGREAVVAFLTRKWERELDYALRKSLWAFSGDHIAVRFQYEWREAPSGLASPAQDEDPAGAGGAGRWWRSYGNENWEFDEDGYMRRREASINDVPITEAERRIFGPRGEDETDLVIPLA